MDRKSENIKQLLWFCELCVMERKHTYSYEEEILELLLYLKLESFLVIVVKQIQLWGWDMLGFACYSVSTFTNFQKTSLRNRLFLNEAVSEWKDMSRTLIQNFGNVFKCRFAFYITITTDLFSVFVLIRLFYLVFSSVIGENAKGETFHVVSTFMYKNSVIVWSIS